MELLNYTSGLMNLPWWGYIIVALAVTHMTIVSVTLFLHRCQTHRGIIIHPVIAHLMRFWLWISTGMITKEWVAIHRKHHHKVETKEDPHSPRHHGLSKVLWDGTSLYRKESANKETLRVYGQGTPNDWIERNIYTRRNYFGIVFLLLINFALFGFVGISIWALQMMWIPFFAAGVINGAAHAVGYRNFETSDDSTNIVNIGIIVGGEELHNNHHAFPASAKFSIRPWEFDIGWLYIRLLSMVRLITVRNVAPTSMGIASKHKIETLHNLDAVKTLLNNRLHVMAEYMNTVMQPVFSAELRKAKMQQKGFYDLLKTTRYIFFGKRAQSEQSENKQLEKVLSLSHNIRTTYQFKNHLQALWKEHKNDHGKLRDALLDWCHHAEQTGINALQDFALRIKCMQQTAKPA